MGKNSRFFMEMRIAEQVTKLEEEFENFVEQEELDSYHWSLGQCVS